MIQVLMLLMLCCLSAALSAQGIFAPTEMARKEAESYLKPLPGNGVVPLKTIAGDFASNQMAASGKYSDRRITVIGRIAKLSKGSGDNKVLIVTLQDASANLPAVKGEFLSGTIPQNSELEISGDGSSAVLLSRDRSGMILGRKPYLSLGQRVGLKGSFKEIQVGDIVLTDCALVSKQKLKELSAHD
jgi:hypothetical protein